MHEQKVTFLQKSKACISFSVSTLSSYLSYITAMKASLSGLKLAFTKDRKLFPFSFPLEIGKVSEDCLREVV